MSLRIQGGVRRGPPVTLTVNGEDTVAYAGETVATALRLLGFRGLRRSPRAGQPRGVFCAMGVCQECVVRVDGRMLPACLEPVRDGMSVVAHGAGRHGLVL